MVKSKITRIPKELAKELINIKQTEKIKRNCDGFRKIAHYSRIGREVVHKDLLHTNALWFGIQMKKNKTKRRKK